MCFIEYRLRIVREFGFAEAFKPNVFFAVNERRPCSHKVFRKELVDDGIPAVVRIFADNFLEMDVPHTGSDF